MLYDDPNLELMPGWRRAFRTFGEAGYKQGDVVPLAWFQSELGVDPPENGTEQMFSALRLKWLNEFSRFHERLRDERQLALIRDGDGYRVMTPSEQLRYAQGEMRRRVRSALRFGAEYLMTTDVSALTETEQAQHADALARLSRVRSATKALAAPPKKADA